MGGKGGGGGGGARAYYCLCVFLLWLVARIDLAASPCGGERKRSARARDGPCVVADRRECSGGGCGGQPDGRQVSVAIGGEGAERWLLDTFAVLGWVGALQIASPCLSSGGCEHHRALLGYQGSRLSPVAGVWLWRRSVQDGWGVRAERGAVLHRARLLWSGLWARGRRSAKECGGLGMRLVDADDVPG